MTLPYPARLGDSGQAAWIVCDRCQIWWTWPYYQPVRCSNCGGQMTLRSDP